MGIGISVPERSRIVLGSLSLALLAGCASMAPGVPTKSGYRLAPAEADLLTGRLDGAVQPNVALALSGGGLRSSLFNFGVLKALYDDGILDDVDLVSAVSGGSYLAYYLYTLQLQEPGKPFASTAFDDAVFAQRTCELVSNANFVTYGNMALAAAKWPVWRNGAFRWMYEQQIDNTFGNGKGAVPLGTLAPLVREHRVPYLVVNTTTYGKQQAAVPWNARLFEFTPLGHGNFELTHVPWPKGDTSNPEHTLLYATAASGAAQAPLRRAFTAPFGNSAPTDTIELWDGGKAENLGAAAALLRGSRNLIVVDAQYDDRGSAMEAYHTLQRRMDDLGVGVSLDTTPQYRATRVYPGRAVGQGLDSRLFYVKMDIPPAFRELVYSVAGTSRLQAAKPLDDTYWSTLGEPVEKQWQCQRLAGFQPGNDWMYFQAASYMRFAEGNELWKRVIRSDPPLIGAGVNHAFPRTTTFDQSFYLDQALAFIGLGYVIADERVKALMEAAVAAESHPSASSPSISSAAATAAK